MKSGATPKSGLDIYYKNGVINFLSIDDMNDKYLKKTRKHITNKALNETNVYYLKKSNLILSIYATIGNVCINTEDVAIPQSVLGLVPEKKFDKEFIYYLLIKKRNEFLKLSQTGSQPNISKNILKDVNFNITTDFLEQQKISNFLSLLDKQIDLYVRKLELTKTFFKYVNKLLYKKSMNNKILKISDIFMPRQKLEPIKSLDGFTPISIMLNGNGFKESNLRVILSKNGRKYYERVPGDIIIGLQNFHNGSIAILGDNFIKPIMSNAIASFTNISNVPSVIIKWLLLNNYHQFYLKNIAEGSGQKEFTIKKILESKIPIPDQKDCKHFANLINLLEKQIILLRKKIENLETKKKYFLNKMFV